MTTTTPVQECSACSDAGLLVCSCSYYATWPMAKPAPAPRQARHPGRFYRDGHRAGRSDAARRLWKHLDPEGRKLAVAIATEGGVRID